MKVLLTLYGEERPAQDFSPEEGAAEMAAWEAFDEAARAAGVLIACEGSRSRTPRRRSASTAAGARSPTGRSWRPRSSSAASSLLEVRDLDEALEWAERTPWNERRLHDGDPSGDGLRGLGRRAAGASARVLSEPSQRAPSSAVPRALRAGGRGADPRRRRLGPGRGGGPGRVRDGGRALAARRRAARPAGVDRRRRAQPRDRPRAARARAARARVPELAALARTRTTRPSRRTGAHERRRRAAAADLHLLPSGARARGAGRA